MSGEEKECLNDQPTPNKIRQGKLQLRNYSNLKVSVVTDIFEIATTLVKFYSTAAKAIET